MACGVTCQTCAKSVKNRTGGAPMLGATPISFFDCQKNAAKAVSRQILPASPHRSAKRAARNKPDSHASSATLPHCMAEACPSAMSRRFQGWPVRPGGRRKDTAAKAYSRRSPTLKAPQSEKRSPLVKKVIAGMRLFGEHTGLEGVADVAAHRLLRDHTIQIGHRCEIDRLQGQHRRDREAIAPVTSASAAGVTTDRPPARRSAHAASTASPNLFLRPHPPQASTQPIALPR